VEMRPGVNSLCLQIPGAAFCHGIPSRRMFSSGLSWPRIAGKHSRKIPDPTGGEAMIGAIGHAWPQGQNCARQPCRPDMSRTRGAGAARPRRGCPAAATLEQRPDRHHRPRR
jgi:hypothetical protein